jgi:hypothetical protein
MKLPHLHKRHDSSDAAAERALEAADYDAQADLALPSHDPSAPSDGFVPFAGELSPHAPNAGYDALRDTGIDPG